MKLFNPVKFLFFYGLFVKPHDTFPITSHYHFQFLTKISSFNLKYFKPEV